MTYSKDNPFQEERKKLGKTIQALRIKKEMTQEDLADKAEMNSSYLAKVEGGFVNPSIRILIKIAGGLSTSVKDLITF